jgi:hypothetical protein
VGTPVRDRALGSGPHLLHACARVPSPLTETGSNLPTIWRARVPQCIATATVVPLLERGVRGVAVELNWMDAIAGPCVPHYS